VKFIIGLLLLLPLAAFAQNAQPTTADPVTNKRAVHLAEQLRCLVCQNQTIADSNAALAVDLRRQIREQIAQGKSDSEITGFMVERYGDFVLYRPPVKATTLLLWLGPPVLLLVGFGGLFRHLRARRKRVETRPLSDEERRQAQVLLGGGAGGEGR
jgi:cytochrome c-type biogenesis protein CcmH